MAVWVEDTEAGQVRVETGTGLITELKHEAGKRNAQAIIQATHQNFRNPVTAWVDTADSAVWPAAQQAHAERYEIEYRIEVHRKSNVAIETPVKDLANTDKVRDLAAIARKGELAQLDREPPATATSEPEEQQQPDTVDEPASAPTPPRRRRIEEGKPWELYNSDRSLNLASYSYQATAETVELAHRLIVQHDREQDGDQPEFRMGRVVSLAKLLEGAADQVQAKTRQDGCVDHMDGSHRRARYAVRSALDVHPIPWDADNPTREAWLEQLVTHATDILAIAYDLFQFHETGAPR